jgi:hypothetical protein
MLLRILLSASSLVRKFWSHLALKVVFPVNSFVLIIHDFKVTMSFSGIQGSYTLYSWFSNSFKVPSDWKNQKVLLNFDAVDYEATVFVNGKKAGFHRGGYFRFTVDVTQYVKIGQENEL